MIERSSDVLTSPRMDSRTKDRSKLYKRRNESPKFRDVLRERCHSRIKASRRALLDEFRHRSNPEEIRDVLVSILHEEIKMLKHGAPDAWEDPVTEEPADHSEEQWILREYEKVLEEEEHAMFEEWQNEVICPLCEKSSLTQTVDGSIYCGKCEQRYPTVTSLQLLRQVLDQSIVNHNVACDEKSQFALINEHESVSTMEKGI